MPRLFGFDELGELGEGLFAAGIKGAQFNASAGKRRDAARGENLQREVQGERAGMKEVERPEIDGASGEVGAAGSVGGDGGGCRRGGLWRHAEFLSRLWRVGDRKVSHG